MIRSQQGARVPSPSIKTSLRILVKNLGDVNVLVADISTLSSLTLSPSSLLIFLLFFSSFLFPVPAGGCDGLDGVGGQRPHVTYRVQEVLPCGQANRDLSTTRLKTLNILKLNCEESIHGGSLSQDPIWIRSLQYL